MLALEFDDITLQGKPVVPGFVAGVSAAKPGEERPQIRIAQFFSETYEEQALGHGERPDDSLRVCVLPNFLIGTNSQHDGLGFIPMAVKVEYPLLFPPQETRNLGRVAPGHDREARHLLQEAIVIGRGQGDLEIAERFEHGGPAELKGTHGFTQPAPELAASGSLKFARDFLCRGERVVEVAGIDFANQALFPGGVEGGIEFPATGRAELEEAGPTSSFGVLSGAHRNPGSDDDQDSTLVDQITEVVLKSLGHRAVMLHRSESRHKCR